MAAKILPRSTPSRERLRRLSVVFSVELRLRIVTELYMRPMSATGFYRAYGGGSPSRVAKNFKTLADEGWLRYVCSVPAARGAGKEDLYRATDLAFFDHDTWAMVPYSMRVASSWNVFNAIAPRLQEAIAAANAGEHHELTCKRFLVDEEGWANVIGALDTQFTALFEHQRDARMRASDYGIDLIRADVFLIGFEVPRSPGQGSVTELAKISDDPLVSIHERLAPVLADEVCRRIVAELNRRELTVGQFYRSLDREFRNLGRRAVTRRFETLERIRWTAKVGECREDGRQVPVYRATVPIIPDDFLRPEMPTSLIATDQWDAFERLCAETRHAMEAETFDARTDRYVTWSMLTLDRPAWEQVIAEIETLLTYIRDEQVRAKKRLARSGEEPIAMSVTVGAFESLKNVSKAP